MPDYDVFSQSLPPHWRKVSRQALDNDDNPQVVDAVLDALEKEFPQGSEVFQSVVTIVLDALSNGGSRGVPDSADRELERIYRVHCNQQSIYLQHSGRAVLGSRDRKLSHGPFQIATSILADFVLRCISPNALISQLHADKEIPFATLIDRQDRLVARLRDDESFQVRAYEMFESGNATNVSVRNSRKETCRPSQDEMIYLALTT